MTPPGAGAGDGLVNWESPHVHPLELTPDGHHLLAVNTAAARLEVFDVSDDGLEWVASIPVGLDPVSVRALDTRTAWVVNHVSDSVSIVDLSARTVLATILTGDEPADVVFAGDPLRAFVSISQENRVAVLDPSDPGAAPALVSIAGEDPRALATDGTRVFVAIFESGNDTTILPQPVVSSPANPHPGDPNPPPNDGDAFAPRIASDLPTPPAVSLVVRKDARGRWLDDNAGDWSPAVTWDLHGHDVAVIDARALDVSYVTGLVNLNMSLAVSALGDVVVVGTEAMNHVRFEPNLRSRFARVMAGRFPAAGGRPTVIDLNPHLDGTKTTVEQAERDRSIGDPRGVAFSSDGSAVFVTGMGSNNLVALDTAPSRVGRVDVGEGPTGVVVDDARGMIYVLNRFEGTISRIDAATLVERSRAAFHDPTPLVIRRGRPLLYDTHATSGLGHVSCASCHVDGRMDQLAWDLGDPTGAMKEFNQVCDFGVGDCEDWHPMKGPMATQTLMGLIGTEPLHWRADREDLSAFSSTFVSLMGDDEEPGDRAMLDFELFIGTLTPPPNPYRTLLGALPEELEVTDGNPLVGSTLYSEVELDGAALTCNDCHALPTGTNGQLTSAGLILALQSMKIPQLRNMYEKTGFDDESTENNRGFGYLHDGSIDSVMEFLRLPQFTFEDGPEGEQQRRDVTAFLFALSTDTPAGVGAQVTVTAGDDAALARRNLLRTASELSDVALIAKGVVDEDGWPRPRGWMYLSDGLLQSDRAAESATVDDLDRFAAASPVTWTLVPAGTEVRYGIDRDADGHFDQDERDACSDPADATSTPGDPGCVADLDDSGSVDVVDLLTMLGAWGAGGTADIDCSGTVDAGDVVALLGAWGRCD